MPCTTPEDKRKGFAFGNPDLVSNCGWGSIITPDELRYVYSWGNALVATTGETYTDEMLKWYIDNAVRSCESDLNVDLMKRRRRHREYLFGKGRNYQDASFADSVATVKGAVDLSGGADLSTSYNLSIKIDGGPEVVVDCRGATPAATKASEVLSAVQAAIGASGAASLRRGKFLEIRGLTRMGAGSIEIGAPANDAKNLILGSYCYSSGWRENVDFFWEEPYDFDRKNFNNFIYVKLRHRQVLKLWKAEFRDIAGGMIMDILDWTKPNYEKGSLEFFPQTGAMANIPLFAGVSFPIANSYQALSSYPDAFFFDYDSGFEDVLDMRAKWPELMGIVGMLAAINLLNDYGDGRASAIASSSIGLAGISESYSTTMSATNAMFGARIISYREEIKRFYKENKRKYAGVLVGAL